MQLSFEKKIVYELFGSIKFFQRLQNQEEHDVSLEPAMHRTSSNQLPSSAPVGASY